MLNFTPLHHYLVILTVLPCNRTCNEGHMHIVSLQLKYTCIHTTEIYLRTSDWPVLVPVHVVPVSLTVRSYNIYPDMHACMHACMHVCIRMRTTRPILHMHVYTCI